MIWNRGRKTRFLCGNLLIVLGIAGFLVPFPQWISLTLLLVGGALTAHSGWFG